MRDLKTNWLFPILSPLIFSITFTPCSTAKTLELEMPFTSGTQFWLNAEPLSGQRKNGSLHTSHVNKWSFDMMIPVGTQVVAAASGVVSHVVTDACEGGIDINTNTSPPPNVVHRPEAQGLSFGNYIVVAHRETNPHIATLYAHLQCGSINNLQRGDLVSQGQTLGRVGLSGETTTDHLHFEVRACSTSGTQVPVGICENDSTNDSIKLVTITSRNSNKLQETRRLGDHWDLWNSDPDHLNGIFSAGEEVTSTNGGTRIAHLKMINANGSSASFIRKNSGTSTFNNLTAIATFENGLSKAVRLSHFRIIGAPSTPENRPDLKNLVTLQAIDAPELTIPARPESSGGGAVTIVETTFPSLQGTLPSNYVGYYYLGLQYDLTILTDEGPPSGETTNDVVGSNYHQSFVVTDSRALFIDDSSSPLPSDGYFQIHGQHSTRPSGFAGYDATYATDHQTFGEWHPNLTEVRRYDIWVHIPKVDPSKSGLAQYEVTYADTEPCSIGSNLCPGAPLQAVITIDQDLETESWISLGRFLLAPPLDSDERAVVRLQHHPEDDPQLELAFDAIVFFPSSEILDFDDVQASHWFFNAVAQLRKKYLIKGRSDIGINYFGPNLQITRAEFLKLSMQTGSYGDPTAFWTIFDEGIDAKPIFRSLFQNANKTYPFYDDTCEELDPNDPNLDSCWYYRYLYAATLAGMVQGELIGDSRYFKPDQQISRSEAVKLLIKAFCFDTGSTQANTIDFVDVVLPDAGWYAPQLLFAKRWQIVQGFPDGTFRPANKLTRAEAAQMIWKSFLTKRRITKRTPFSCNWTQILENQQ